MSERELPAGWATASLGELCVIDPKHSKELDANLPVTFLPMSAVSECTGEITTYTSRCLGEVRKGYTHFANQDVLFAKITPCMENGKGAIARKLENGIGCGSTEFFVFRSFGALVPKFLFLYLRQKSFREEAKGNMTGVVGQARVPRTFLSEYILYLPPIKEQYRIASRIDVLQARSRRAREALTEAQTLLEQFRQSVLTAAFRGDLTAKWRKEHPDAEPAAELLQRIRIERRKRWEEAEQAKYQAKGKKLPEGWKKKYPEPVQLKIAELPELPQGWCWASLDECGQVGRGKSKHRPRNDPRLFGDKYPFIQTGEVARAERYITNATKFYSEFGLQQSQIFPIGTLCITIAANIADTAILKMDSCFPDSVVGVIPDKALVSSEYLEFYLSTVKSDLSAIAPATAQKNINLEILNSVAVPIPPAKERQVIEHMLFLAWEKQTFIKECIGENTGYLDNLDQSILAKAFRGELVQQNPNDEPASVLMKQIRSEKQNSKPTTPTRGKKKA